MELKQKIRPENRTVNLQAIKAERGKKEEEEKQSRVKIEIEGENHQ